MHARRGRGMCREGGPVLGIMEGDKLDEGRVGRRLAFAKGAACRLEGRDRGSGGLWVRWVSDGERGEV